MIKELFDAIGKQCLSVEGIAHTAIWNQQLTFIDEEEPFKTPAVFVEVGEVSMKEDFKGALHSQNPVLRGQTSVTLHLLTSSHDGIATAYCLAEALADVFSRFSMEQPVFNVVNMDGNQSVVPCHDHEEIIETLITFTLRVSRKAAEQTRDDVKTATTDGSAPADRL